MAEQEIEEKKEKYKEEQKKRISSMVVGGKDYFGNFITKILSGSDEYIIYEIKTKVLSESIRVIVDSKIEDDRKLIDLYNSVRVNFAKLKGLLYKVNDDTSIKSRIAHIIAHALNDHAVNANEQFDALIKEIETEYEKQFNNRLRYLITTLIISIFLILASVRVYHNNIFLDKIEIRYLIFVTSAGATGGFLSVSRRIKETVFEKGVKWGLYIAYGIERSFISIFSAAIIYLAIRSNLIFGLANELEKPILAYIVFCVIAGFSETLVPNLLIKLEREHE